MHRQSFLLAAITLSLAALTGSHTAAAEEAGITGAGSSFVSPLYRKWAQAAKGPTALRLNYRTVDFGASDAVKQAVRAAWARLRGSDGKPVWTG